MVDTLNQDSVAYIPSTVEKKRAISSLFFVGIVMMMAVQKELSVFERYYLALSLSLRSIGLMAFLIAILVFFLASLLGYLYVIVLLAWFGVWGFSVQQARAGKYNHEFVAIRLIVGFGNWIVSLFEEEPSSPTDLSSPGSDTTSLS